MRVAGWALLAVYFSALGGLALLGLHRLYLSALFLKRRPSRQSGIAPLPEVTVQLPVFNEVFVLDRLVQAACALRYPRHLLEIQILDDSTDSTSSRAAGLAELWRGRGFDVVCLHRARRDGYKAGALAAGLESARGELIAVFDADFVPPPDFLERTVPRFSETRVGMVQARWGHLNRARSALTRAQALMLDAHFGVEQAARSASGRFFNFNGTAGIFRRSCIEEAGGWQCDTLTEDLDLSYRAQMAGWKFVYLDDLLCPAELPADVNALRSQQHRWAKGSMQTALKILPRILRARLPLAVKSEAAFHLLDNAAYLLLFVASILVVPSLALRLELGWRSAPVDLAVFLTGTCAFGAYAAVAQTGRSAGLMRSLLDLPVAMALGIGLALNNALAVVEALLGIPSGFRRTPKLGLVGEGDRRRGDHGAVHPPAGLRSHPGGADESAEGPAPGTRRSGEGADYRGEPTWLAAIELSLALVFTAAIAWAWRKGLYTSLPFLTLFGAGYGYVSILTILQQGSAGRAAMQPRDVEGARQEAGRSVRLEPAKAVHRASITLRRK